MATPVPRKVQVEYDLKTLPQDVADIKTNVGDLHAVVNIGLGQINKQFDQSNPHSVPSLFKSILDILDENNGWIARKLDHVKLEQVIISHIEDRNKAVCVLNILIDNNIHTACDFIRETQYPNFLPLGISDSEYNSICKSIRNYLKIK